MEFVFYEGSHLRGFRDLPGVRTFMGCLQIYGPGFCSPIDRSGTVKFPVRTKSLFPLPQMRVTTKSYEELCNERAVEVLNYADKLDVPIYVFWSGGIDSTLVLVSLLKQANNGQKERICVLMTTSSITENPNFYYEHIRGKLQRRSAMMFPYMLGSKTLILTGEHNDQLFGSDIIAPMIALHGREIAHKPYDRGAFFSFFHERMKNDEGRPQFYVDLFDKVCAASPIPLKSNFDVFWWMNFAIKWQSVYARMLSYAADRTAPLFSQEYVERYYMLFFNTEEFQLWSMNNLDKRMRDSWATYKWPAKDILYEYTKDDEYRDNKIKYGSLVHLVNKTLPFNFIDTDFKLHREIWWQEFHEPDNDFK